MIILVGGEHPSPCRKSRGFGCRADSVSNQSGARRPKLGTCVHRPRVWRHALPERGHEFSTRASTMKVPVMDRAFSAALNTGSFRMDQGLLMVNQFASIGRRGSPYLRWTWVSGQRFSTYFIAASANACGSIPCCDS